MATLPVKHVKVNGQDSEQEGLYIPLISAALNFIPREMIPISIFRTATMVTPQATTNLSLTEIYRHLAVE